jgi:CHAT domain-containing protein
MRNATFTIALLAAIFLLQDSSSFAQDVTSYNCPPAAALSGEEEALRAATKKYLTALRAKDWDAISKLSVSSLKAKVNPNTPFSTDFNQTHGLMKDLLQPLEIEGMSFEIQGVSGKPCEASVRYTLSLRTDDPQTRKLAIDVTDFRRMVLWKRFECDCPPGNVTEWKISSDVADVGDMAKALAAAKTTHEQRLLMLGQTDNDLEKLATDLSLKGYDMLAQERTSEAFNILRLGQVVLGQIKHHERFKQLMELKELEKTLGEARKAKDPQREASTLHSMGDLYLALGQYEQARKLFEDSLNLIDVSTNAEAVAKGYEGVARTYIEPGEYARATRYYLKILERYKSLVWKAGQNNDEFKEALIEVLYHIEILYEAQGRDDLAQRVHQEIFNRVKRGGEEEAAFLYQLSELHMNDGNIAKAAEYLEKNLSITGFLYFAKFITKQLDILDNSKMKSEMEEDKWVWSFLYKLAELQSKSGNIAKAIEYLEMFLSITKRLQTPDLYKGEMDFWQDVFVLRSSIFLTELYLRQNNYSKAARYLVQVQDAWKSVEESTATQNDIIPRLESLLYGAQGSQELATFRSNQSIKILINQALGKGGQQAATLNILTQIKVLALEQLAQEKWEAARERLSLLIRLAEPTGDEFLIAQAYWIIAEIYHHENNNPLALENYNKSLQVLERTKPRSGVSLTQLQEWIAIVRYGIGQAHASLGNYEQALSSYRNILERRSSSFYKQNDTDILYAVAATYFGQGRYDMALSAISEALSLAKNSGKRDSLWKIHTLTGKIHRALKHHNLAAYSFKAAIKEIEASRYKIVGGERITQRFFEDKLTPYYEMIAMLVEQNRCQEALGYGEQSKSRVLLDVLKQGRKDILRDVTDQEREQEQALKSRMFAAERQFELAKTEQPGSPTAAQLNQIRNKRVEARLEYEAFRADLLLTHSKPNASPKALAGIISPAEIAELMPAGGALLEFVVTDDKTYLFILTGGGGNAGGKHASSPPARCMIHSIAIGAEELNNRVEKLNQRIANSDGVVQPLARELYDLLLKPSQEALNGRTTLVIVPDRYLWTLPFQALQLNDGRYLLQESAIYYAPSLSSLKEMKKTRARNTAQPGRAARTSTEMPARSQTKNPTLLVMANPAPLSNRPEQTEGVNSAITLSPLLKTETQARALAGLYGPGRSKVYVRADADEGRFREEAQGFDVIHLGAHGILDDDDPMYSRIVLSGAKKRIGSEDSAPPSATAPTAADTAEDGLLEAWEIMDLKLKANLVVLSACETARGRVGDGEGLVGLTWALFMAGVPSTVVSQWKVDEEATTELMYSFHESLVRSARADPAHPRKAEALRQASLKLIGSEKYRHPYYWAGFVLVGDGN